MGYDVLGIGSPLLDVTVNISDNMLEQLGFKNGSSSLITAEESRAILDQITELKMDISPGGSAANTLSGVNVLGNKTAFLGVIGNDDYGRTYLTETVKEGVISKLIVNENLATGHSYIFITPDGERTMAAHLGAASAFEAGYVSDEDIVNAKYLHIEAYQLADPAVSTVLDNTMSLAKSAGVPVSLDLSDAGLVTYFKDHFNAIVDRHVDILFANEEEAMAFTGLDGAAALNEIALRCKVAVVKLGARGSMIKSGDKVYEIAPHKVEMINTNGAGDMYAAGFLHGLINNLDIQSAGEIAGHVSALVVASRGARLDQKYYEEIRRYKNNN